MGTLDAAVNDKLHGGNGADMNLGWSSCHVIFTVRA
jgi:hypothetical protein